MKKLIAIIICVFSGIAPLVAQQSDSLFLNIAIPEEDTTITTYSRYRVAAGTHPMATAFINGEEAVVYANGAFASLIPLEGDTNKVIFRVVLDGVAIEKQMVFLRPIPSDPIPSGSKTITYGRISPNDDIWLKTGEVLKVRFQGSSGEQTVFNIDGFKRNIPMTELPIEQTDGVPGIYEGSYELLPGDVVKDQYLTFKMKKGLFGYVKKKSPYRVSFNDLPRVAEVTSDNAYLNIGMGTDRLGGARYGHLEKEIRLKVIGQMRDNYKVSLSPNLSAWIPIDQVELLPKNTPLPTSLAGNIRITGNGMEDMITLNLSQKLPYTTTQELDPNRIIVNVWGATSNTNWKTEHLSASGIKDVEWRQVSDGHYQLIIELNHKQNWGYSVGYGWRSQMVIKVKRAPVYTDQSNPLSGRTIAIDAGHGGDNQGSLGSTGLTEKAVTLQISRHLDSLLTAKGAKVLMTREDDGYVYQSARAQEVIDKRADLLVSIHANSIGYTTDPFRIQGTGAFYKHIAFKPLAEKMYEKMLGLGFQQYGVTGSFNFSLNAPIEFPNVLVETAFMSNPEDEVRLSDPDFQIKMAEQIIEGLEEYYRQNAILKSSDLTGN